MAEYVSIGDAGLSHYTSADENSPIDLTNVDHTLSITLTSVDQSATWTQPAEDSTGIPAYLLYTSADLENPLDFITSTNEQVVGWPKLLFVDNTADWHQQVAYSVVPGNRIVYTIDFASRTSFNSDNDLNFDPPQYWIGA